MAFFKIVARGDIDDSAVCRSSDGAWWSWVNRLGRPQPHDLYQIILDHDAFCIECATRNKAWEADYHDYERYGTRI